MHLSIFELEISPIVGDGVDFAKGNYRILYGEIDVSWKKENSKVVFEVEIPVNTKATFIYNDKREELEPGKHIISA